MTEGNVLVTLDAKGVATVTLNRPEIHNAFGEEIIAKLTQELRALGNDEDVRVVVLNARGKSFCSGADLNWMKRTAKFSEAENLQDVSGLAELLLVLDTLPKPTIALIQGPAYAGGVGLICACDIAIAVRHARFSLTEVRLGMIPAVISPFVINRTGYIERSRSDEGEQDVVVEGKGVHMLAVTVEVFAKPVGKVMIDAAQGFSELTARKRSSATS